MQARPPPFIPAASCMEKNTEIFIATTQKIRRSPIETPSLPLRREENGLPLPFPTYLGVAAKEKPPPPPVPAAAAVAEGKVAAPKEKPADMAAAAARPGKGGAWLG